MRDTNTTPGSLPSGCDAPRGNAAFQKLPAGAESGGRSAQPFYAPPLSADLQRHSLKAAAAVSQELSIPLADAGSTRQPVKGVPAATGYPGP